MRVLSFFVLLVLASATHVFAGQGWEIEAHGGVLTSGNPSSGTASLPPIGPDILVGVISVGRRVPSWYFGDGATMLNQIIGTRSPARIIPLDPVLESRIVERESGGSFGIRVARALSRRFAVEFAFDDGQGPLTLRAASRQVVSSSATSFTSVWNTLLSPPSNIGVPVVTSEVTFDDKRGRQLITTGSLLVNLLSSTTFTPYLAVGAGYIVARGGAPSVTMAGSYNFVFSQGHYDETDSVTIQAVEDNSLTWVFGGGGKYALGDHWGVRADVRDYVNRDAVRTVVFAKPSTAISGSLGTLPFAFSQMAPPILFSSSALGLSTLSEPLNDVQTFKGRGIVNQVNASVGIYWRF
jgi:hypothetical protein